MGGRKVVQERDGEGTAGAAFTGTTGHHNTSANPGPGEEWQRGGARGT